MKKIGVNTVKAFLKEHKNEEYVTVSFPVADSSFDVQIKTVLTTDEKSAFISRVLSGCFDSKKNFRPEYVTPMLRATILQMCTNVPVITLKGEQDDEGGSLMDVEAMSSLYAAMNLDHLENAEYQDMMGEIVQLSHMAIEWKKNRLLSAGTESLGEVSNTIRHIVETIAEKVDNTDMASLLEYAGSLSRATQELDENGLVKGLVELAAHKE